MSLSNSLGLLGRKVGMMRLFTDDGDAVPVTVVDVSNNRVTQIKSQETDGYVALQVTFGSRKASRVTKPQAGHLAKAGVEAGEIIQEFRVTADTAGQHKAGGVIAASSVFAVGQKVRLPVIDGHRDTNDTACPGRHLYAALPRVRRRARRIVRRYADDAA